MVTQTYHLMHPISWEVILFYMVLGHLANAGLNSIIVNRWSDVFDFTPTSLETNWKCLAIEDRFEDNLNEEELIYCTE
jgi:hypothetical protein